MTEELSKKLTLEIDCNGSWQKVANLEFDETNKAYYGKCITSYDFEYLINNISDIGHIAEKAISVVLPINYSVHTENKWPSFLLDIIPMGAAKRSWLKRLQLEDKLENYYLLLKHGAINPIGNIRIQPEGEELDSKLKAHPGFEYSDIIMRSSKFIDYAEEMGAIVSGASGAQGESPKFILVKDKNGKWHADGAIAEDQVEEHWIVKHPRGKLESDNQILKAEAAYYEIASKLGLNTYGPVKWDKDSLFIKRFDRIKSEGKWKKYGFESFTSALGISEYGENRKHTDYIKLINKYSHSAKEDIKEYIFRDFLNITMGNTDNHGRNSAFIKNNGKIRLSPLFDFAPMAMDSESIPRASKWEDEVFRVPNFDHIAKLLVSLGFTQVEWKSFISESLEKIEKLENLMEQHLERVVIEHACDRYTDFKNQLSRYIGKLNG